MSRISIQKSEIEKRGGVVILPLEEYEKLLKRMIPTYHLTGTAAKKLDRLVSEGVKGYKAGRTRKIRSLADLD